MKAKTPKEIRSLILKDQNVEEMSSLREEDGRTYADVLFLGCEQTTKCAIDQDCLFDTKDCNGPSVTDVDTFWNFTTCHGCGKDQENSD